MLRQLSSKGDVSAVPLLYRLWASNMAKITGFTMIIMGFCCIPWYVEYNSSQVYDLWGAVYGM